MLHYQIPYGIRKGYKGQHTVPDRDKTELLQQKHTLSLFEMNGYKRKAQTTEVDKHMIFIASRKYTILYLKILGTLLQFYCKIWGDMVIL